MPTLTDLSPDALYDNRALVDDPIFQEFPLVNNVRFPYDINTGDSMVDLGRIMLNKKLMKAINKLAAFQGSIMSEFAGGGSEYEDTISSTNQGGIGAAVAAKSRQIKKPEKSKSNLVFDVPDGIVEMGVGHPVAKHQLNRTAVNERIDELMRKNPNEDNLRDNAWAKSLDENLRSTVLGTGKELLIPRGSQMAQFKTGLTIGGLTIFGLLGAGLPFLAGQHIAADTLAVTMSKQYDSNGVRLSLMPAQRMLFDRYLALAGLVKSTKLIKYRK